MSSIVAFAVGSKYAPGNGIYMVGAHTDSPCLKVKPKSKGVKSGHAMLNVETYGGGLWTTWFDRDLSVAGRVLVQGADGKLQNKLVRNGTTYVAVTVTECIQSTVGPVKIWAYASDFLGEQIHQRWARIPNNDLKRANV
jgi:hypothetical protein